MRVVYLGTDAMLPCLEYLLDKHEVMVLYTCGGQEDYFRSEHIASMAHEAGIPCNPEPIDEAAERRLIKDGCELFISADYGRKIPVLSDWDKSHLIMVYDPSNVFFNLVCQYFAEDFFIYVHQ